ncbi:MAG TPA: glycine--tRNA ligase subunit beta [Syntrophomonadaceae bacterium]|nr:glycine--tRNA ligase subunit beta [Syntrophomonadaceae bacterium]
MVKDLLLEIGVEELPSGYMAGAIKDLKKNLVAKFEDKRLVYGKIDVYGTPRRLVIHVENLSETQTDAVIENRGPKKEIAYDAQGQPSKAGLGFARGQGVAFEDLEIRELAGAQYLFVSKTEKGEKTINLLPNIMTDLITELSFPKSMRWGNYTLRFARPIRWILALYGNELLNFTIENLNSSNYTYGHRFLSSGSLKVQDINSYFQLLNDNYVILDQNKRKELIWQQIKEVADKVDGSPMENESLLEEVTYLVEYPTAFYGSFSTSYLDVPVEVLTTSMIEHQRYFPVFNQKGELLNGFIGVRNGTDYNLDVVKAGNERVLKARLEDALFFWNEDTKLPLNNLTEKLDDVLFHEKLGSLLEKVKRLEKIALYIGEQNQLSTPSKITQAALLCKADLVSNMVNEFPELQGVMGRYYAIKSGEDEEVAEAILEHYLPRFAGDVMPQTDTGKVLSLAEKIDNMVGSFAIGIKPTGSQDPYALRRQAMGLVNLILETEIQLDIPAILGKAYQTFDNITLINNQEKTVDEVYDFILQRFRGVMLERNISYDVIDAVLAVPSNNINILVEKSKILTEFKNSAGFEDFMVVFNRSYNLSKKWNQTDFDENLLVDPSEISLHKAFAERKDRVIGLFDSGDYLAALNIIIQLRPYIDEFFDAVMVMVDDENLKSARLSLLKCIADLCMNFADFNKIVS